MCMCVYVCVCVLVCVDGSERRLKMTNINVNPIT